MAELGRIFTFLTLSSLRGQDSLAVCSLLMGNPVLTNMQKSCKGAADFMSVLCCALPGLSLLQSSQSPFMAEKTVQKQNRAVMPFARAHAAAPA